MGYQTAHYYKFGNTNNCVSYTMYVPDGGNLRSQITNVYASLFGRWGESGGVEGWVNVWNAPGDPAHSGFSSVYDMVLSGAGGELAGINANGKHTGLSTGGCPVGGCTDSRASNYNSGADFDNGTCVYPTPSITLSISPSSYIAPGSATLTWSVSSSTSRTLTGQGSVGSSGSAIVSPNNSQTYTLNASYYGITSNSKSASITVYQPVVTKFISASPNPITVGQSSTLTWVVTGSANTPATIDQGIGNVLFSSAKSVSPTTTTSYTLAASGLGGSDSDTIEVNVNQIPQLSYSTPLSIDYGDTTQSYPITYRYATGGVNGTAVYTMKNPTNGNTTTITQNISLPGTDSDETGAAVTNTFTPNIPWTAFGAFFISISLTASGGGGAINVSNDIDVIIDQLPDNVNVPNNLGETPSDDVEAPDFETVLSDPIIVTDIDVAVEITANEPIQVRFDNADPDIESNWNNVRPT